MIENRGRPVSESDDSTWPGRVAARLRELRLRKYSSQQDFLEALGKAGVSKTVAAVSDWETGRRMPHLKDLPGIAAALGVKVRTVLPDE